MRGPRCLCLLAAALLACTDTHSLLLPELPDDLDYAGVVYRGPRGAWSGSGLYSTLRAPLRVEVWLDERDYEEVSVVGFREADLRPYTQASDAELEQQPLEAPGPRRAPVRASFSATGNAGDAPASLEVDEEPLYVGGYWAGVCPEYAVGGERSLEHYCLATPCPAKVRQVGCGLGITFSSGGLNSCAAELSASLPGVGDFATEVVEGSASCSGETSRDRRLTLRCTALGNPLPEPCELSLRPEPDAVPRFEVETRTLAARPEPGLAFEKALRGLIVRPDHVLTARSRRGFGDTGGCDPHEVELVHVSREELAVTHTATLPPSVLGLLPSGPSEFFAILGGPEPAVVTLSASGHVRRRRALAPELEWTRQLGVDLSVCPELEALAIEPRGRAAVVLLSTNPSAADAVSRLVVVELDTLELRFPPVELGLGARLRTLWFPEDGVVEVLVEGWDRQPIDLTSGARGPRSSFRTRAVTGFSASALLPWPEESVVLLASFEATLTRALVVGRTNGEDSQTRAFWERDQAPFRLVRWTGPEALALVSLASYGLSGEPSTDATLAFFDPETLRFLAPSHELGGSPITEFQAADDGDIFGLSPADGRLHRVRTTARSSGR